MSRGRDPVQQRDDGTAETAVGLHGVVEWSPKSRIDRALSVAANPGLPVALGVLGAVILVHEFEFSGSDGIDIALLAGFIVLSILPALAIAGYVWYADIASRPSPSVLGLLFVLGGAFASYAAIFSEFLRQYFLNSVLQYATLELATLTPLVFFLVTAPIEELTKVFVIKFYAYDSDVFSSVASGAVFGAVVGLGFATVENALFLSQDIALGAASRRALAGPGHVIYSAIAGFYVGIARFNEEYARPVLLKGLLIAIGFHGLYNTLVTPETVDVLGTIQDLTNFSYSAALFTFSIIYSGFVFIFLLHKLSQYRNAFLDLAAAESIDSELTEFDP